jgi:hypothetical protein
VRNICKTEPKIQPGEPCDDCGQNNGRCARSKQGHHKILSQDSSSLAGFQSIALQDAGRGLIII